MIVYSRVWKASEKRTEKLRELRKLRKINFSARLDVRRMDTGHKMTFDNMARFTSPKFFPARLLTPPITSGVRVTHKS